MLPQRKIVVGLLAIVIVSIGCCALLFQKQQVTAKREAVAFRLLDSPRQRTTSKSTPNTAGAVLQDPVPKQRVTRGIAEAERDSDSSPKHSVPSFHQSNRSLRAREASHQDNGTPDSTAWTSSRSIGTNRRPQPETISIETVESDLPSHSEDKPVYDASAKRQRIVKSSADSQSNGVGMLLPRTRSGNRESETRLQPSRNSQSNGLAFNGFRSSVDADAKVALLQDDEDLGTESASDVVAPPSDKISENTSENRSNDADPTVPNRKSPSERDLLALDDEVTKPDARSDAFQAVPSFSYSSGFAQRESTGRGITVQEVIRLALAENKTIQVLGYAPKEASTVMSTEKSVFDPVFRASVRGGVNDRQIASLINSGGAIGAGANEQRSDFFGPAERNNLSISKLLETGGTIEAGYGSNYLFQDPVGGFILLNPSWRSALNLRFIQPLGRGSGKDVTTAPLRIAQVNHGAATYDFRAQVNAIVRDAQLAYWDWKLAQRTYAVRQAAIKQAEYSVHVSKKLLELGEGTLPDVQQAQDQLQRYLIDARNAKNTLRQARIVVAELLGSTISPSWFETPLDEPAPLVHLDEGNGMATAMTRPELMAARSRVKAAEIQVNVANDGLRPDLNLQFDYSHTGLESGLDDSLETLFTDDYDDWAVRLEYARANGLRAERATVNRARFQLARIKAEHSRLSLEISSQVSSALETVAAAQEVADLQKTRVEIARKQVEGRSTLYREGEGSLDLKIRAESSYVDALLEELASKISLQRAFVQWQYVTNQQNWVEFSCK